MLEELPCHEKLVFETKHDAEAAAVYAKHRHGTMLKAYVCKHCKLWHLSTD
jgi:hypothetical protein